MAWISILRTVTSPPLSPKMVGTNTELLLRVYSVLVMLTLRDLMTFGGFPNHLKCVDDSIIWSDDIEEKFYAVCAFLDKGSAVSPLQMFAAGLFVFSKYPTHLLSQKSCTPSASYSGPRSHLLGPRSWTTPSLPPSRRLSGSATRVSDCSA